MCIQDGKKIERERYEWEEMVFDTGLYFYERVIDLEFEYKFILLVRFYDISFRIVILLSFWRITADISIYQSDINELKQVTSIVIVIFLKKKFDS